MRRTAKAVPAQSIGTVLEIVRGAFGALQLARPGFLAGHALGHPLDPRARGVTRVLAARQLTQAVVSGPRPTYSMLALGVEVDLLHAASMLGLGLVSRRRRRAALSNAMIAATFAAGGLIAARSTARSGPHGLPDPATGWRDRCADRLARALVPGYPSVSGGR